MDKILFIDRDGTLIVEPPTDFQVDSLEKLAFLPKVFRNLYKIQHTLGYKLVMVTNQDGLGTDSFPEETFWKPHNKMMQAFEDEGVTFEEVLIDKTFASENAPTRKPQIGLVTHYLDGACDLENSYVIGDRLSDIELAKNMGTKGIWIASNDEKLHQDRPDLVETCRLVSAGWDEIYEFLVPKRVAQVQRTTKETDIAIEINLDGTGKANIETGIGFFDHMLEQIARHGQLDLYVRTKGDLHIDEHHTIEDTAIALGSCFLKALGEKRGIERYGFCLPMDDVLAQVAIDFGGRSWLVWEADFKREMVGKMPTEMFMHFFKSFADAAQCNLNIKAEGTNEHHKIEGIFKAFAKAIRVAKQHTGSNELPSTKGML